MMGAQERSAARTVVKELRVQLKECSDSLETKQLEVSAARSAAAAASTKNEDAARASSAAADASAAKAADAEAAFQRR